MVNRALDVLLTDSVAFVINMTAGKILRWKICNYSWDDKPTETLETESDQTDK